MLGEPTPQQAAALAAVEISAEEEQQVGRFSAAMFARYMASRKTRVITEGREVDQLRSTVQKVRCCMTRADRYRRLTVYIVESPRFDARVFPGGHIFFFRGLLESIASEAAMIGVIAHELAHLDRGHALLRLKQIKLIAEAYRGDWRRMTQQQRCSVQAAMMWIWTRPTEPQLEAQADLDAVRWTYQLGYDPRELGRLVMQRYNTHANQRLPGVSFSQSHATRQQRGRRIFEEYARLQEDSPEVELKVEVRAGRAGS